MIKQILEGKDIRKALKEEEDFPVIPGTCPHCGGEDLDYGAIDHHAGGDELFYPFTCNECGKSGKEFYELKYSGTEKDDD